MTPATVVMSRHVRHMGWRHPRACCTEKRLQLYGCIAQYGAFWKVTPATMKSVQLRNSSMDGLHGMQLVYVDKIDMAFGPDHSESAPASAPTLTLHL